METNGGRGDTGMGEGDRAEADRQEWREMNGGGERWTAVGGRNRELGADGGPGWKESRESEHRRAGGGHRREDAGQRSAETKTHGPSWEMGTERDGVKEAENSMGPERREPGTEGPRWADGSRKEKGPGESGVGGEQEAGASPAWGCGANRAVRPAPQTSLLLLLLLLSPGLRGTPDCSFRHSPISSTFADTIRKLVSHASPRPLLPPCPRPCFHGRVSVPPSGALSFWLPVPHFPGCPQLCFFPSAAWPDPVFSHSLTTCCKTTRSRWPPTCRT